MSTAEKISRGAFRHVEAELYAYHDTLKEIEKMRADILHAGPEPNLTGGGRPNTPSDSVGLAVSRLTGDKRLITLSEVTDAIKAVYERQEPSKQKLIRLKYWTKPQTLTWEGIAMELNVSRITAIRWRDDIVKTIAEKIGWR